MIGMELIQSGERRRPPPAASEDFRGGVELTASILKRRKCGTPAETRIPGQHKKHPRSFCASFADQQKTESFGSPVGWRHIRDNRGQALALGMEDLSGLEH